LAEGQLPDSGNAFVNQTNDPLRRIRVAAVCSGDGSLSDPKAAAQLERLELVFMLPKPTLTAASEIGRVGWRADLRRRCWTGDMRRVRPSIYRGSAREPDRDSRAACNSVESLHPG